MIVPAGSLYSQAPAVCVSQLRDVEIPAAALKRNWIRTPDPILAAVADAHERKTLLAVRFTTSMPAARAALVPWYPSKVILVVSKIMVSEMPPTLLQFVTLTGIMRFPVHELVTTPGVVVMAACVTVSCASFEVTEGVQVPETIQWYEYPFIPVEAGLIVSVELVTPE